MTKAKEIKDDVELILCDACEGMGFWTHQFAWWTKDKYIEVCPICKGSGARIYNNTKGYFVVSE